MNSIRARLTTRLTIATALLCIAAAGGLYLYVRAALLRQFDASLETKARALGALLRVERDGRYELDFAEESMPEYMAGRHAEYFRVVTSDGAVLEVAPSLGQRDASWLAAPDAGAHAWNLRLPDSRNGRAAVLRVLPRVEDEEHTDAATPATQPALAPVLITVAADRSGIDRVLNTLTWALAVGAALLAAGSGLVARVVVHRGLRPVGRLADQATAINADTLAQRFGGEGVPVELRPISDRLNDLLSRLEQAFARERRLTADVAHELRTPIAELRVLTDVALKFPTDAAQSHAYFRDASDVARRMESLVEALLALSRGQAGRTTVRREAVPVAGLVQEIVARASQTIARRELSVHVNMPESLTACTDPTMFRRILENLIDNAIEYAPSGGRVECGARANAAGACELVVANTAHGLLPADLPHLFEPFWRKDAARSGDTHAGLGLALVAQYAATLGITLWPHLPAADWFEMKLVIPADAPS